MGEQGSTIRMALLAPMPSELRPLVAALRLRRAGSAFVGRLGRVDLFATGTGIGTRRAAAATARLLDGTAVEHVMVVGIAGGLGPSRVGEVIVPDVVVDKVTGRELTPSSLPGDVLPKGRLVTHDDFALSNAERDALVAAGFVAVDMETAAVAAVCADRGVPWSVVRSVSDLVGVTPDDVISLAKADGTPDVAASLRYVATKPWRVPRLVRLGVDARGAARAAAAEAARRVEAFAR